MPSADWPNAVTQCWDDGEAMSNSDRSLLRPLIDRGLRRPYEVYGDRNPENDRSGALLRYSIGYTHGETVNTVCDACELAADIATQNEPSFPECVRARAHPGEEASSYLFGGDCTACLVKKIKCSLRGTPGGTGGREPPTPGGPRTPKGVKRAAVESPPVTESAVKKKLFTRSSKPLGLGDQGSIVATPPVRQDDGTTSPAYISGFTADHRHIIDVRLPSGTVVREDMSIAERQAQIGAAFEAIVQNLHSLEAIKPSEFLGFRIRSRPVLEEEVRGRGVARAPSEPSRGGPSGRSPTPSRAEGPLRAAPPDMGVLRPPSRADYSASQPPAPPSQHSQYPPYAPPPQYPAGYASYPAYPPGQWPGYAQPWPQQPPPGPYSQYGHHPSTYETGAPRYAQGPPAGPPPGPQPQPSSSLPAARLPRSHELPSRPSPSPQRTGPPPTAFEGRLATVAEGGLPQTPSTSGTFGSNPLAFGASTSSFAGFRAVNQRDPSRDARDALGVMHSVEGRGEEYRTVGSQRGSRSRSQTHEGGQEMRYNDSPQPPSRSGSNHPSEGR